MVNSLGNDFETAWRKSARRRVGRRTDHAFRHHGLRGQLRLRAEGLRSDALDRSQAGPAHGPLRARWRSRRLAKPRRTAVIDIAKEPERIGAAIATGIGGLHSFQECTLTLFNRGADRVGPFAIPSIIPNMGAAWVSMELGTRGPLLAECAACAASNMAIGDATDAIRLGRADVMLAGGTEAGVTPVGIAGFAAMRAISRRNDDPKRGSRPFDRDRDGFVMGEGAAVLVLEELEHARARGAKIYAEVRGLRSLRRTRCTSPSPTPPARTRLAR